MTDTHHLMAEAMQFVFDATQIEPSQGSRPVLPAATYKVRIKDTDVKPAGQGIALFVHYEITEGQYAGTILVNNYNYINPNATTTRIALEDLSAIGHVTGIYKFGMADKAAPLRGAQLQVVLGVENVTDSNGSATGAQKNKYLGYLDLAGNKPGKKGNAGVPAQTAPANTAGFGGGYNPSAQPPAAPAQNFAPAPQQPAQGGFGAPQFGQQPAQAPQAFQQPQQQFAPQPQQAPAQAPQFAVQQNFQPPAQQPTQPAFNQPQQQQNWQAPIAPAQQPQQAQPPFQQQQSAPAPAAPWGGQQ